MTYLRPTQEREQIINQVTKICHNKGITLYPHSIPANNRLIEIINQVCIDQKYPRPDIIGNIIGLEDIKTQPLTLNVIKPIKRQTYQHGRKKYGRYSNMKVNDSMDCGDYSRINMNMIGNAARSYGKKKDPPRKFTTHKVNDRIILTRIC